MNKLKAMLALAALALSLSLGGGVAFASVALKENGVDKGPTEYINYVDGPTISGNGAEKSVDFSPITYEGTTADASETTVDVVDPTADRTILWPDASGTAILSSASPTLADAIWGGASTFVAEGATADAFETTLAFADPTADQTATVPNYAVSYALVGSTLTTNAPDAANSIWLASNGVVYEGATANAFETTVSPTDPTADRTVTIPDSSGTVMLSAAGPDLADSLFQAGQDLKYEGTTADANEAMFRFPADPAADYILSVPAQTGTIHVSSGATALTPGASVTLTVQPGNALFTDTITTDNQDQTIDASGAGSAGDSMTIIFTTDAAGSGDEVITFGTNFLSTGTLTLANLASDVYSVSFVSNGTKWVETARTTVQTT